MNPLDLLIWSIFMGSGAVGLTVILRNAPVIRGWVQAAKKPWACNVCMPLYMTAGMAIPLLMLQDWRYLWAYPGGYALAYIVLEKMSRPPPGPPKIPADFFTDDEEEGT